MTICINYCFRDVCNPLQRTNCNMHQRDGDAGHTKTGSSIGVSEGCRGLPLLAAVFFSSEAYNAVFFSSEAYNMQRYASPCSPISFIQVFPHAVMPHPPASATSMTATFMHVNFDAPRYTILVTTMRLPSLLRIDSAAGAQHQTKVSDNQPQDQRRGYCHI